MSACEYWELSASELRRAADALLELNIRAAGLRWMDAVRNGKPVATRRYLHRQHLELKRRRSQEQVARLERAKNEMAF